MSQQLEIQEVHFIKTSLLRKVYKLYLRAFSVRDICFLTKLEEKDINNIIDYLNYLYN